MPEDASFDGNFTKDQVVKMFKVGGLWFSLLSSDLLWYTTGGEIEWESDFEIIHQQMEVIMNEERYKTMVSDHKENVKKDYSWFFGSL